MAHAYEAPIKIGDQGCSQSRILVVAGKVMSGALQCRFQKRGWPVASVGTTAQALGKFRSERNKVVICNVRLGGECGLSLVKQLLTIESGTAVILMTEFPSVPEAVSAMRDGAYDYLIKPLDFTKLDIEVEFLLTRPTRKLDQGH